MYKCEECGEQFDEPNWKAEWQGDKEHGGNVNYAICPKCGSDDLQTMGTCPLCDEYIDCEEDYCEQHKAELDIVMNGAVSQIEKTSSADKKWEILQAIIAWCEEQE